MQDPCKVGVETGTHKNALFSQNQHHCWPSQYLGYTGSQVGNLSKTHLPKPHPYNTRSVAGYISVFQALTPGVAPAL